MDSISFRCGNCNQALRVGVDKIGRTTKCPRCGSPVTVPPASAPKQETEIQPAPQSAEVKPPQPPVLEEAVEEVEEYDAVIEDDEEEDPVPKARGKRRAREEEEDEEPKPAGRRARRRRNEEEDDEEEDYPRRRSRRRSRRDEEDEEEEDRPRRRGASMASRWAKVRVGILLVFIAACILGGAVFLEQIPSLLFMVGLTPSLDILRVFGDILQICAVLVLGQGILAIVGYCFCLVVPNKHAALGLAIAALALGGVNLILRLTFGGIHFGGEGNFALGAFSVFDVEGRNILPILRDLLFLAELLVFPLFLRAVALARKEEGIASMCLNVVIVAAVHAGVKLVYYLVIYSFANSASRGLYYVINTLYWITVLIFLGQIAFYAITLKQTRDAL